MRTTLTLEPDVAAMLKKAVAEKGETSFKAVVNEALRKGLTFAGHSGKLKKIYKVKPWSNGGSDMLMSWAEVKQLLDDEEVERYLEISRRQSPPPRD